MTKKPTQKPVTKAVPKVTTKPVKVTIKTVTKTIDKETTSKMKKELKIYCSDCNQYIPLIMNPHHNMNCAEKIKNGEAKRDADKINPT